jgi:hypothetical protein
MVADFAAFTPDPVSLQVLPVVETGFSSVQIPAEAHSDVSHSASRGAAFVSSAPAPVAANPALQAPLARSLDDSPNISGFEQQAEGDAWML